MLDLSPPLFPIQVATEILTECEKIKEEPIHPSFAQFQEMLNTPPAMSLEPRPLDLDLPPLRMFPNSTGSQKEDQGRKFLKKLFLLFFLIFHSWSNKKRKT